MDRKSVFCMVRMPNLDTNINMFLVADTCYQPHYKLESSTADKPLFLLICGGKESLFGRKLS